MNTDLLASIHHDGSACYVVQHGGTVTLRLRADSAAPIERVFVRAAPDGEQKLLPMQRAEDEGVCQWWQGELPRSMPRDGYRFSIVAAGSMWWLSAVGLTRHTPTDVTDFKLLSDATMPQWVRDSIFYQIFPDRFADGDPGNNVRDGDYTYRGQPVYARSWNERPARKTGPREFFGGDLEGIAQKLDYLRDLGVTALYLTPIFTSPSSHKYDSVTYDEVDPHFGGDAALVALRAALDARDMRLIIDLVPNHSGDQHVWFKTALADPNAPEASFYTFHKHPHDYEAWLGVPTLPKLNYRSAELRRRMYEGEDAIARRWLRPPFRVDGWRIDVSNMLARQGDVQLGHKIGRGLRRAVKAENPQAYLLGENFYDGTPHLQGEELDATMNYRAFTFPLLQWLNGEWFAREDWLADLLPYDGITMAAQWTTFLSGLPYQIALQQFNLLGSHDTPRVLTMLDGDIARLRVARTLLYAFPGVPCVYYGDEVGMQGGEDPDNRRPMLWDETQWNQEVLNTEKQLTRLRASSPALRSGGFQLLHASADTVAFLREAPEQRVLIIARRAADISSIGVRHAGLADGTRLRDLLGGAEATVTAGQLGLDGMDEVGVQVWQVEV